MKLIFIYFLLINLLSFILMYVDKKELYYINGELVKNLFLSYVF